SRRSTGPAGTGRLLRQADGFEGLLRVVVVRDFFDLAGPQLANRGIAPGKFDAASLAPGTHQEQADGSVLAHGPDLHVLQAPTLPALHPDPDPFADTVVSSEVPGVESDVQVVYLDGRVPLGEDRLPVAAGLRPGKTFNKSANDL